jgi:cytochrome c peroxidase
MSSRRLDTPPSNKRRHPDSRIAHCRSCAASIHTGGPKLQLVCGELLIEVKALRLSTQWAFEEQSGRFAGRFVVDGNAANGDLGLTCAACHTQAVAAFERTIEPGLAPFDRWVEGDEAAIPPSAKRGFAVFTGKAGCSACHSGWRFTDDKFHDIGTTTTDLGRGGAVKDESLNFAFKTPTLRSVALRAPYMHNASVATLGDVVKLYEKGGIARPSRSPMLFPLGLTDQERLDLVAFMETLTGKDEIQGKTQ